jgi:peptide/nickel transport system ATP-binding protein
VEEGPTAAIVRRPLHPYTAALLSAAPDPNFSSRRSRIVLPGDTAARLRAEGCAFQPRCPVARPRCRQEAPPLEEMEPEHRASCFFPGELPARTGEPLVPSLGG